MAAGRLGSSFRSAVLVQFPALEPTEAHGLVPVSHCATTGAGHPSPSTHSGVKSANAMGSASPQPQPHTVVLPSCPPLILYPRRLSPNTLPQVANPLEPLSSCMASASILTAFNPFPHL